MRDWSSTPTAEKNYLPKKISSPNVFSSEVSVLCYTQRSDLPQAELCNVHIFFFPCFHPRQKVSVYPKHNWSSGWTFPPDIEMTFWHCGNGILTITCALVTPEDQQ